MIQLAVLAVVGTYYVRRQLNQPSPPSFPSTSLGIPIFRLSILTSICSFTAQMLAMVSLPFFLQNSLGYSEVMTGLLLTPWPIATLVTAPAAGYLVERIHPGILGSIGMALFCIGLYSLSTLTADSSVTGIILRLMLCGAGFGLFRTPNNSTIISCPYPTFGRSQRNVGYGTALGTDIRYDTGCFALQFCSTREEYGGLPDSRQRICVYRSSGKQHAAFTTLHIKDEAPITISIHVYRPTGNQSNTK